ncbi:hypothetical protein [Bacillus toyonensis]|uniref:hypothetical protein n=1 Tax=Bacillus toyonensis TaxID=155322 RepID=UPI002E24EC82|nr:hypothetical protein [Bacillus toyonensis]
MYFEFKLNKEVTFEEFIQQLEKVNIIDGSENVVKLVEEVHGLEIIHDVKADRMSDVTVETIEERDDIDTVNMEIVYEFFLTKPDVVKLSFDRYTCFGPEDTYDVSINEDDSPYRKTRDFIIKKFAELGWKLVFEGDIKPKYIWRTTYQAIKSDSKENYEHNGKGFTVLEDITDKAVKNDPEYGYVRTYRIRLEDEVEITALEVEVEDFPS